MKNRNKMSRSKFFSAYIVYALIAWGLYSFYFVPHKWISALIFPFFITLTQLLGYILTLSVGRNRLSLLVIVSMPYSLYTVLTESSNVSIVCSLIALSAALIYLIFYLFQNLYIFVLKTSSLHSFRKVFISGTLSGILTFAVLLLAFGALANPLRAAKPVNTELLFCQTDIRKGLPQLRRFIIGGWQELSLEDKLEHSSAIAALEADNLGLDYVPEISIADLEDNVAAYFSPQEKSITIDREYLETRSGIDILNAVCHEMRHAYQLAMQEVWISLPDRQKTLVCFRDVAVYYREFNNYIDHSADLKKHFNQLCEIDAREYAASQVDYYINSISICFDDSPEPEPGKEP